MRVSLHRPETLGAALAVLALAVLAVANYIEHVEGVAPCKLCLYQRVPWWLALGLGSAAVALRTRPRAAVAALAVAALALAVNAGLAGYHVGVEQGWWAGPSGCSGAGALPSDLTALNEALKGPPPAACDEIAWTLFGLSMAAYNFLISAGAAIAIVAVAGRPRRR